MAPKTAPTAPSPTPIHHLTIAPAHTLPTQLPDRRWLVEELWSDSGVGVIGGEPKACKTALALDLVVSVASGKPCLRHYRVPQAGPVLLYTAEDSAPQVRQRLEATCQAAGAVLAELPIHVIVENCLQLDFEADRVGLELAVMQVKPRLLVLDPFVRLHAHVNENSSGAVAPLLGYLRQLQRRHGVAVVVVHHTGKRSKGKRAGQALRGSSDFHAWGDSNLYLHREATRLMLTTEHRAAASQSGIELREVAHGSAATLAWSDPAAQCEDHVANEVTGAAAGSAELLQILKSQGPLTTTALRNRSPLRHSTVRDQLDQLRAEGQVTCRKGLWRLSSELGPRPRTQ